MEPGIIDFTGWPESKVPAVVVFQYRPNEPFRAWPSENSRYDGFNSDLGTLITQVFFSKDSEEHVGGSSKPSRKFEAFNVPPGGRLEIWAV